MTTSTATTRPRRVDEFTDLAAVERMARAAVPTLLFTVLGRFDDGTLSRVHSSDPEHYPVGGHKHESTDLAPEWIESCLVRQQPAVGNTPDDVRRVFADHALIEQLGCGSYVNAPVVDGGRTIATVCVLAGPGAFGDDEVAAIAQIANGSAHAVLSTDG